MIPIVAKSTPPFNVIDTRSNKVLQFPNLCTLFNFEPFRHEKMKRLNDQNSKECEQSKDCEHDPKDCEHDPKESINSQQPKLPRTIGSILSNAYCQNFCGIINAIIKLDHFYATIDIHSVFALYSGSKISYAFTNELVSTEKTLLNRARLFSHPCQTTTFPYFFKGEEEKLYYGMLQCNDTLVCAGVPEQLQYDPLPMLEWYEQIRSMSNQHAESARRIISWCATRSMFCLSMCMYGAQMKMNQSHWYTRILEYPSRASMRHLSHHNTRNQLYCQLTLKSALYENGDCGERVHTSRFDQVYAKIDLIRDKRSVLLRFPQVLSLTSPVPHQCFVFAPITFDAHSNQQWRLRYSGMCLCALPLSREMWRDEVAIDRMTAELRRCWRIESVHGDVFVYSQYTRIQEWLDTLILANPWWMTLFARYEEPSLYLQILQKHVILVGALYWELAQFQLQSLNQNTQLFHEHTYKDIPCEDHERSYWIVWSFGVALDMLIDYADSLVIGGAREDFLCVVDALNRFDTILGECSDLDVPKKNIRESCDTAKDCDIANVLEEHKFVQSWYKDPPQCTSILWRECSRHWCSILVHRLFLFERTGGLSHPFEHSQKSSGSIQSISSSFAPIHAYWRYGPLVEQDYGSWEMNVHGTHCNNPYSLTFPSYIQRLSVMADCFRFV